MFRFMIIIFVVFFALINEAQAQVAVDDELMKQYVEEARADAREMVKSYQSLDKPAYQKAYDNYLKDLEVIAETGKAPDNEALYDDLRQMDSDEPYVYMETVKAKWSYY